MTLEILRRSRTRAWRVDRLQARWAWPYTINGRSCRSHLVGYPQQPTRQRRPALRLTNVRISAVCEGSLCGCWAEHDRPQLAAGGASRSLRLTPEVVPVTLSAERPWWPNMLATAHNSGAETAQLSSAVDTDRTVVVPHQPATGIDGRLGEPGESIATGPRPGLSTLGLTPPWGHRRPDDAMLIDDHLEEGNRSRSDRPERGSRSCNASACPPPSGVPEIDASSCGTRREASRQRGWGLVEVCGRAILLTPPPCHQHPLPTASRRAQIPCRVNPPAGDG